MRIDHDTEIQIQIYHGAIFLLYLTEFFTK